MTETELDDIERVWANRCHGTHWHACHLNSGHHVCAINLLSGEVRRLRRELDRVRWLTGVVRHSDDQIAECVGCGCVSATAEECVAELVCRTRAELAAQKAAAIALAERLAACSAVLGKAAERGKVCDCQRPPEGTT